MPEKTSCSPSPPTDEKGLVSIFTGDGKGKTTAAIGTAVRAAGHGLKVLIIFFAKREQYLSGEVNALSHVPNITVTSYQHSGWLVRDNIKPGNKELAKKALAQAKEAMLTGKYDLIILDEINIAVYYNLISLDEMLKFINDKPNNVELILTGRYADPALVKIADLVTEMVMVKHPYNAGVMARAGIDY